MSLKNASPVERLVRAVVAGADAGRVLEILSIDGAIPDGDPGTVSRGAFAMALNVALFHDLMTRAPSGAAYVAEARERGETIRFDHGALRTIRFPDRSTGALPPGSAAFARILEPLGYRVAGLYPLPRLKMTGYAYAHDDLPETIPQFFVSELHVDRFDAEFGQAAQRVFGTTIDPLGETAGQVLAGFATDHEVAIEAAIEAFPGILAAFGRHHAPFAIGDYELLLAHSAEAAWIATEGNAFNHATSRVDDVEALAERLRAAGHAIKDRIEVSRSGRVRQTALRADGVERTFVGSDGRPISRTVPGSFYEFISRDRDPETGALDLAFDSGNATGIFAMTTAAA